MKRRFIMITIFQDWDVSSNANEGSLACNEVESNDESSEDEEESESDTGSSQTSEPICENSPVTQMDVAIALLQWFSKYPGVSKAAVGDLLSLLLLRKTVSRDFLEASGEFIICLFLDLV